MNTVFMLAEYFATFIEGTLAFLTIGLLCGWKSGRKKSVLLLTVFSVLYTVLITILNAVDMFSMGTMLAAILFVTGISYLLNEKKLGYRLSTSVLYFFTIAIIDSVVNIVVGVILGDPNLPMHIVSTVGIYRTIYILSIKCLEIAIYSIFRKRIKMVPNLSFSGMTIGVVLTLLAFFSVYYTYSAVLSLSIQRMQISLALAWIAMLATVILLQLLFTIKAKQKEKEQENEMLQSVNAMIEKNYENLERSYLENAKNIHDFRHHVMALDELLTEGEFEEAQGYIRSLHEAEAHGFSAVITGNAVIDAVLNAHHSSAQASGIDFSVTAQPLPDLTMGSWELSTLFSNLLENAREACEKVKGREPWIEVKISVANRFLLLEIRNTSDSRPEEKEWKTTKREKQGHGLGLLSVEDIVEKYNGSLKRSCSEDGIVEVSVMCETISTITDNN